MVHPLGNDHFESKENSILVVIKISTSKGQTEIVLRENTNISEAADRIIVYGGMKGDLKSFLEGYLFSKLNEARP